MEKFDVTVIGSGSGSSVAKRCTAAGKKTAIIDNQPYSGTCALRGCDPKKVLVGIAHALSLNQQLQGKGIATIASPSWKGLMQFKTTFTAPKIPKTEAELKEAGVVTFHGRAKFIDENTIRVNDHILYAEKFVIANGATPAKLSIPGEDLLIDSTVFLALEELPKDILLVGGGYIAFEFAHIVSRFGVKATIVHRGGRPLKNFDADLVRLLVKASEELGIQIVLNAEVKGITKENNRFIVHTTQNGKELNFSTSLAVHAAGRTADILDMGLEKMNVSFDKKGVAVNEYMQSVSNENVYSCGDANDKGMPLTPVGGKEAIVLASNLLKGNHKKIEYGHIPSNVFTIPALGAVGLTEQEAKNKNLNYTVHFKETTDWYSSRRLNEPVSGFKVLVDKETDQIIGAHLLGTNAEETINLFTLAMNAGITASVLRKTIFSYPTNASDIVYML
ncbi:MAG: NAD(P)/FAD-dependent oxidoreductase [Chitinophagaceae bacterium]|nr:MAG: NAD(P)/FAD-dependent oxidoreductase [Chitinophagaceae bacterium]